MKRLIFVFSILVVFASGASAADLTPAPYTKAPGDPSPAYNWSGLYAGVTVGGGWYNGGSIQGSNNLSSILPPADIVRFPATASNSAGVTAGGLVGYNFQVGKFVVGAETDFSYTGIKSQRSALTSAPCCGGVIETFNFQDSSQVQWFGTARGRIGFTPVDRLLIYGTGGLAYGEVETAVQNSAVFSAIFPSRLWQGSTTDVRVGWTAGAGLEYAFTANWTLRSEYLYVDIGEAGTTATYKGVDPNPIQNLIVYGASRENRFSVARATLNYKF